MGAELAREMPVTADVVVPVPDSGVPAAIGYARASGIPFELGIIRNHYVGRTFIQPTQSTRELGVRLKHSATARSSPARVSFSSTIPSCAARPSLKIVRMMREAGAREVHFRISSPPIKYPDYYGIDTPEREKLLAATHSLEEMRDYIGCDFPGLPVGGRAPTGRWARHAATPSARSSPIIASRATIRPI